MRPFLKRDATCCFAEVDLALPLFEATSFFGAALATGPTKPSAHSNSFLFCSAESNQVKDMSYCKAL